MLVESARVCLRISGLLSSHASTGTAFDRYFNLWGSVVVPAGASGCLVSCSSALCMVEPLASVHQSAGSVCS